MRIGFALSANFTSGSASSKQPNLFLTVQVVMQGHWKQGVLRTDKILDSLETVTV